MRSRIGREMSAALVAACLALLIVLQAPGWAFVNFHLSVVPAPDGMTVVVQTRNATWSRGFYAHWNAEIVEILPEGAGIRPVPGCEGAGANTYTWQDGDRDAMWPARLSQWLGSDRCAAALKPGLTYYAEATWRFEALSRERFVTARSEPFVAQ